MQKRLLLTGAVFFCASLVTPSIVQARAAGNTKMEVAAQLSELGIESKQNAPIMRDAESQERLLEIMAFLKADEHAKLFAQFLNTYLPVLVGFKSSDLKAEVALFNELVMNYEALTATERESLIQFGERVLVLVAATVAARAAAGQGGHAEKKGANPGVIIGASVAGAVLVVAAAVVAGVRYSHGSNASGSGLVKPVGAVDKKEVVAALSSARGSGNLDGAVKQQFVKRVVQFFSG